MVSTRKRDYSSIDENATNSDEPIVKRRKPAIGKSASRKRRSDETTTSSEKIIQKRLRNGNVEPQPHDNICDDVNSTISNITADSGVGDLFIEEEGLFGAPEDALSNEHGNNQSPPQQPSSSNQSENNGVDIINANIFPNSRIRAAFKKYVRKIFQQSDVCKNCECGYGICRNVSMSQECPRACKNNGRKCRNRFISEKRGLKIGKQIEMFLTRNKDYGIQARVAIPEGTYVGEYNGEIIDQEERERRDAQRQDGAAFYLMKLGEFFVDGEFRGSSMRYMNHSCDPNCETREYLSADGTPHNVIFTIKNISPGEELTFNYSANNGENKFKCYCEANGICTGSFYA